ncbi:MAG: transcriptional repressor NrdR [Candidatus Omnitrophica bacterium]|nr:transcriptional repressor NrdR [Candidatus Omnitrophota bacterium]
MKCPYCGVDKHHVVDSRTTSEGEIRRRRECQACKNRFTTYERVMEVQLRIIKRDKRREDYDREKIAKSIRIACQKRAVSEGVIQDIAKRIEHRLFSRGEREIPSEIIGEEVMKELIAIDQVAYVRFASVYRQFKDLNQFIEELSRLMNKRLNTSESILAE